MLPVRLSAFNSLRYRSDKASLKEKLKIFVGALAEIMLFPEQFSGNRRLRPDQWAKHTRSRGFDASPGTCQW